MTVLRVALAQLNPIVGEYATSDGYFISLCMLQAFHYWPEVARGAQSAR